ncbi:hypothetical protein BY996DRAFT_7911168 [Phakopsora pachyrhizi]|nr:hypothetical protein BY996DRAFT_7911168 [Phakopsora pachyrhizi]
MQDALHLFPIDSDGQRQPRTVALTRNEDLLPLHKDNLNGQVGNPLLPAVEPGARQQQGTGSETNSYLSSNGINFPYGQYNSFWPSAEGVAHHQNQLKSPEPDGFTALTLSQIDKHRNKNYNLHPSYLQAGSNQLVGQTTDNLMSHQPKSYPLGHPFWKGTPAFQIAQPAISKSPYDSTHISLAPNFGCLTEGLVQQVPTTYGPLNVYPIEKNRKEINANSMQADPLDELNSKFTQIGNTKHLDGKTLRLSRPSHRLSPSSDSEATVNKIETSRFMKIKDNDTNLAITSKKRKRTRGAKIEVFQDTVENRELIIASMKKNFWVHFGDNKSMSAKPIWFRPSRKKFNTELEKATDISILNFGANFDKQAEEQVKEIAKEMSDFTMSDKKITAPQISKMKIRLYHSIQSIRWNTPHRIADNIPQIMNKISYSFEKKVVPAHVRKNITNLSNIATIFMKVISSFFSHHGELDLFGDEKDILHYLEIFWETCITEKQDMRVFCQSIGAVSNSAIKKCLSIGLTNNVGLDSIFERLQKEVFNSSLKSIVCLQLAWSLVSIRFGVLYPRKTLRLQKSNPKSSLIVFVENALMYFIMRSEKTCGN